MNVCKREKMTNQEFKINKGIFVLMGFFLIAILPFCSDDPIVEEEPIVYNDDEPYVFKSKLSDYGFFAGEMKDLNPVASVEPYELTTPLFSDHTIKHRFFQLRAGTSISYTASGVLDFPEGTIIIKTFSSFDNAGNEYRIETRLLVLDPFDQRWKVMDYLWNEAQTDAEKLLTGKSLTIKVKDEEGQLIETDYNVPNVNQCKVCHSNGGQLIPIGPKARSLNFTPPGWSENQLTHWTSKNLLKNSPSSGIPVLADWQDELNFSLNDRARAYLDINCAHCHSVGGDASYTGLFLDYEQIDTTHLGYFKSPIAAGPGSGNLTYDIYPGYADSSILYYRMNSVEVGTAMPELARSLIHEKGVQLIKDWINSL
jgi:uncharacterized repeat protein (TIGR03806 family)